MHNDSNIVSFSDYTAIYNQQKEMLYQEHITLGWNDITMITSHNFGVYIMHVQHIVVDVNKKNVQCM